MLPWLYHTIIEYDLYMAGYLYSPYIIFLIADEQQNFIVWTFWDWYKHFLIE